MDKAKIQARLTFISTNAAVGLVAFWPVCCWYIQRTFDSSDEPWGVLALLSAVYFARKAEPNSNGGKHLIACALMSLYIVTYAFAPHLVQGIIMVAVLWYWILAGITVAWRWGIFGLLILSLPIVPSINFFAGYPLRLLVSKVAQLMLACFGIHAAQEGTVLLVANMPISIDAPCSGISMLWVQLFSTMLLVCYFKVGGVKRIAILTAASIALILLANSVRAVALILFDCFCQTPGLGTQLTTYESSVHVGAGLIALMVTIAATAAIARKLSACPNLSAQPNTQGLLASESDSAIITTSIETKRSAANKEKGIYGSENSNLVGKERISTASNEVTGAESFSPKVVSAEGGTSLAADGVRAKSSRGRRFRASALIYSLCACAALVPFVASSTVSHPVVLPEPEWPTEILGHKVVAVPSLNEEKSFPADFPGHMRRFTDGTNNYFVRVVSKETRQLHPSSDCFKGMGYNIEPQPLLKALDGSTWSSFKATKGGSSYRILEQLHDTQGHTWTDVSAWYWHALTHSDAGPWWDVTVATPAKD